MMKQMKKVETQVGNYTNENKFSLIHMAYKGEAKIEKDAKMKHRYNTVLIPL